MTIHHDERRGTPACVSYPLCYTQCHTQSYQGTQNTLVRDAWLLKRLLGAHRILDLRSQFAGRVKRCLCVGIWDSTSTSPMYFCRGTVSSSAQGELPAFCVKIWDALPLCLTSGGGAPGPSSSCVARILLAIRRRIRTLRLEAQLSCPDILHSMHSFLFGIYKKIKKLVCSWNVNPLWSSNLVFVSLYWPGFSL